MAADQIEVSGAVFVSICLKVHGIGLVRVGRVHSIGWFMPLIAQHRRSLRLVSLAWRPLSAPKAASD